MPELPEIYHLARQMNDLLTGKTVTQVDVLQPKCLNVSLDEFRQRLIGARLLGTSYRGKWTLSETTRGWLLFNLGMGGEMLLVTRATLPEKFRLVVDFEDQTCLAVNFWWFGYAHFTALGELDQHTMTAGLGKNAVELDGPELERLLQGRRGQLKTFLLDQANLAGIGNFYIHDILFLARLHPLRSIPSLTGSEITRLADAIRGRLQYSIDKGGAAFEVNLLGQKGSFGMEDLIIGYRENQPCPECGTAIEKIKTGGTSSFICPSCQPL
jgi:formamidopyrimidine-DNA glycosylase